MFTNWFKKNKIVFISLLILIFLIFRKENYLSLSFYNIIPATIIFFYLIIKLYKYLLRILDGDTVSEIKDDKKYIKNDLLIAIIIYFICTILFFYPCLKSFTDSLIGPLSDNIIHYWNMLWLDKVATNHNIKLTFTNYIFYPEGSSLLFQSYSFYNLFLSLLLKKFLTPIALYNVLILHTFVLSGIGAFLLIKYLTKNSYLALIGGFLFAFNPSHFVHSLYHIDMSSIQFIPFFILFFIKMVRNNSKKDLFLACLFFLMNSICNWTYLIFGIYFMGFSYIYLMIRRKQLLILDVFINICIIIGVTVLILSPWLLRMTILKLRHPEVNSFGHNFFVVDIFGLFVPHLYHLLGNIKIFKSINLSFTGNHIETTAYLGIINILIIIFTYKGIIKKVAKYFCGFFVFLLLAMGTYIHNLGRVVPIILPYYIIMHIPFLSNARAPSRAIVYVYLFWTIIVVFGLKHLFNTYKPSKMRNCILSMVILLLFLDYYSVCNEMTKLYLPPCYNAIKDEEGIFGILDLPLGPYVSKSRYMMYQTFHGYPIVDGAISRKIGGSLINYLDFRDLGNQKMQLIKSKVKYIIIHKKLISPLSSIWCPINIQQYKSLYQVIYEDSEGIVLQVY